MGGGRLRNDLAPLALPGGYADLLEDNPSPFMDYAYGRNSERLAGLAQFFDPTAFLNAIPLARTGFGHDCQRPNDDRPMLAAVERG